ncbi:alternate-type signal peptide domain-containing protein [Rhodococcus sp. 15-2388-1-1a]|uniref:alternate-type signal peptide domain-containing protein n=1 Tax=Nocardiaceae TaxID=85025 RepID=UPI00055E40FA|nr:MULTISPECIES: alternate-type signal peptide domain-containing protein [Rhodococcus]OZE91372.1 alternate-type signal peptide domain-containing protein [Rhodococcus sp. 15-2388-1-1a]
MNKATKGAIAAGAAAVLLLGGLGSLALWNDSETLGGGTITSGDLRLTLVEDSDQWQDVSYDVTPVDIDISTFRIVPGDTVAYTANFLVEAEGENLTANLTADISNVVEGAGSAELLAAIQTSVVATDEDDVVLPTDGAGAAVITRTTNAPADQTISVEVRFTFDRLTEGTVAQDQSIDLTEFTLDLTQIRPL